jgi:hypothetical protein
MLKAKRQFPEIALYAWHRQLFPSAAADKHLMFLPDLIYCAMTPPLHPLCVVQASKNADIFPKDKLLRCFTLRNGHPSGAPVHADVEKLF